MVECGVELCLPVKDKTGLEPRNSNEYFREVALWESFDRVLTLLLDDALLRDLGLISMVSEDTFDTLEFDWLCVDDV